MTDWQPIETAPRDGTPVLLFGQEGMDIAHYDYDRARCGLNPWRRFETAEYDNDWADIEGVTHWMHLPAPPASDGDEG